MKPSKYSKDVGGNVTNLKYEYIEQTVDSKYI